MSKLTILVDIDGIVADTLPSWLVGIYQTTGLLATSANITQWDLSQCPPLDTISRQEILSVLSAPGFTRAIPVIPGASTELKRLHDFGHKVYFVTARHGVNVVSETFGWLDQHFPWFPKAKQLCFVHDKHLMRGDIFIDDKPENLITYKRYNPYAELITIDYPYNNFPLDEIYRVPYGPESWAMIRSRIESLAMVNNENLH